MASLAKISDVDRKELLSTMHTQTAKVAKEGYDKLNRLHNAGVLLCIEIGCQIDRLTDNEGIENGASHEVTKLAGYWGMDNTNRLYEWRNTAVAFCKETDAETGKVVYDKSFIAKQMSTPMDNGRTLTFEHFKFLGRLSSSKKRETLLKQVRKNGWSANALSGEIQGSGTSLSTSRSGGRKPVIPGTVFQYVRKTFVEAQKLDNFLIAGEPEVLDKFEKVSTDKADDVFVEKIDNTITVLEHLQKTTQRNIDILLDGRERVVNVIENTVKRIESDGEEDSEKGEEEYVTGTQMAAKIREVANPKKKKKKAAKSKASKKVSQGYH